MQVRIRPFLRSGLTPRHFLLALLGLTTCLGCVSDESVVLPPSRSQSVALISKPTDAPLLPESSTPDQVVFGRGLQNDWQNWGWANISLSAGSMRVTVRKPWEGCYFAHSPQSAQSFSCLEFTIQSSEEAISSVSVTARVHRSPLANYVVPGLPPHSVKHFQIPLSRLGLDDEQFDGFTIQTPNRATFMLSALTLKGKRGISIR